jgi:hypothetical protein
VLSELLLNRNIFAERRPRSSRAGTSSRCRSRSFRRCGPDIDPKLEAILQKALERNRDQRYQSASEMLTDLELYLYSDRYGPTNEKLGTYLRDLFGVRDPEPSIPPFAAPPPPPSPRPPPPPPPEP